MAQVKFVTLGSFMINHEADGRLNAEIQADMFVSRMERAVADGVLVSDYLFEHRTLKPNVNAQLQLFEGNDG